jgi:hypothetical protein
MVHSNEEARNIYEKIASEIKFSNSQFSKYRNINIFKLTQWLKGKPDEKILEKVIEYIVKYESGEECSSFLREICLIPCCPYKHRESMFRPYLLNIFLEKTDNIIMVDGDNLLSPLDVLKEEYALESTTSVLIYCRCGRIPKRVENFARVNKRVKLIQSITKCKNAVDTVIIIDATTIGLILDKLGRKVKFFFVSSDHFVEELELTLTDTFDFETVWCKAGDHMGLLLQPNKESEFKRTLMCLFALQRRGIDFTNIIGKDEYKRFYLRCLERPNLYF